MSNPRGTSLVRFAQHAQRLRHPSDEWQRCCEYAVSQRDGTNDDAAQAFLVLHHRSSQYFLVECYPMVTVAWVSP